MCIRDRAQPADRTVEDIRIQVRCGRGQRVEGRALVAELQRQQVTGDADVDRQFVLAHVHAILAAVFDGVAGQFLHDQAYVAAHAGVDAVACQHRFQRGIQVFHPGVFTRHDQAYQHRVSPARLRIRIPGSSGWPAR